MYERWRWTLRYRPGLKVNGPGQSRLRPVDHVQEHRHAHAQVVASIRPPNHRMVRVDYNCIGCDDASAVATIDLSGYP